MKNKPIRSPDEEAEVRALLKILEFGEQNIREGKIVPAKEAMSRLRERLNRRMNKD